MKFLCLILLASLATTRADLVLQQESINSNLTYTVTLKLHGDKMRMDQKDSEGRQFSVIADLITHDSITLMPKEKQFLKHAGKTTNPLTNGIPPTPVATGITEKVGGYDTEIYQWSGTNGMVQKMWVAKDYPAYAAIQADLAKVDQFKNTGSHAAGQPDVSRLPGMVVRTQTELKGRRVIINLVSAKIEPVSAALFELPADYKEWTPPKEPLISIEK